MIFYINLKVIFALNYLLLLFFVDFSFLKCTAFRSTFNVGVLHRSGLVMIPRLSRRSPQQSIKPAFCVSLYVLVNVC